jgi:hypothetical protein
VAGRPSILTADLRAAIEHELASGATQKTAAYRTGVPLRTLEKWIAARLVVRPAPPPAPPPDEEQPDPAEPIPARMARAEPGLIAAILRAAQGGSWQAAAWLLERSFPDRWGKPEGRQPPQPVDAFTQIDQLAARRRGR